MNLDLTGIITLMAFAVSGAAVAYSIHRQREAPDLQSDRIWELERQVADLEGRLSRLQAAYDSTVTNFGALAYELRRRNEQIDVMLPKLEWYQEMLRQKGIVDRYDPGKLP